MPKDKVENKETIRDRSSCDGLLAWPLPDMEDMYCLTLDFDIDQLKPILNINNNIQPAPHLNPTSPPSQPNQSHMPNRGKYIFYGYIKSQLSG